MPTFATDCVPGWCFSKQIKAFKHFKMQGSCQNFLQKYTEECPVEKRSGWSLYQWQKRHLMKRQGKRLTVCFEIKQDNKAQKTAGLGKPWPHRPPSEGDSSSASPRGHRGVTSQPCTDLRRQQGWSRAINSWGNQVKSQDTNTVQGKVLSPAEIFSVFSGRRISLPPLNQKWSATLRKRLVLDCEHTALENTRLPGAEPMD